MRRTHYVFKRKRGPVGNVVWTVDGHSYYWNGLGSRLSLMFGNQLVSIDASEASGRYETSRAAEVAMRRFVGLPPVRPSRLGRDFYLTRKRHGAGFWDEKSRRGTYRIEDSGVYRDMPSCGGVAEFRRLGAGTVEEGGN